MRKSDWIIFDLLLLTLMEALKIKEITKEEFDDLFPKDIVKKQMDVVNTYNSEKYLKALKNLVRQYTKKIRKELKVDSE